MNSLYLLVAVGGLVLAAWGLRFVLKPRVRHEPVEYYKGWGGYWHPIGLENRISREEADALTAEGAAYLVGHFDEGNRLTRVEKFYRGEFFFEYRYDYHPNGRLARTTVTRGGQVTVLHHDTRGRRVEGQGIAF